MNRVKIGVVGAGAIGGVVSAMLAEKVTMLKLQSDTIAILC